MSTGEREVLLEPAEIAGRIIKTVGVVDAQTINLKVGQQAEDEPMRRFKDLLALHAQGGQVVDVEEAAIVDLVRGNAPVRKPVALVLQQFVQEIEAARVTDIPVKERDV